MPLCFLLDREEKAKMNDWAIWLRKAFRQSCLIVLHTTRRNRLVRP